MVYIIKIILKIRGALMAATFTTRVRYLREKNFLTQTEMADILHLSSGGYRRYEIGERKPTLDVLLDLAEYFNVSLDYLTGRSKYRDVYMPADGSDDVQMPLQKAI